MGVRCFEISLQERASRIHYLLGYSHILKKEKRDKSKMVFCLLKASGWVRARTTVGWEQVAQRERGPRDGRRAGKGSTTKQHWTSAELGEMEVTKIKKEMEKRRDRWFNHEKNYFHILQRRGRREGRRKWTDELSDKIQIRGMGEVAVWLMGKGEGVTREWAGQKGQGWKRGQIGRKKRRNLRGAQGGEKEKKARKSTQIIMRKPVTASREHRRQEELKHLPQLS